MSSHAKSMTGTHVIAIALGTFAVVLAVNILFVVLALDTHSGLDTGDAYTLGLAYNDQLDERARQHDLGWTTSVSANRMEDGAATLEIALDDDADQPLVGFDIIGVLRRPVESTSDQSIVFMEITPGHYQVQLDLPHAGHWDLLVTATREAGENLDIEERLWLD